MDAATVFLGIAALGANFGWQPDERDPAAYEVVVQLEPQLVDAVRAGHAVPIDAHIPPGVAPIRKVRIVVGDGDVPRTFLATTTTPNSRTAAYPPPRDSATADGRLRRQSTIVRGQDPGWSDDRYPTNPATNSRRYEQLGPTIGVGPIHTAQAPPPLQRVQTAVTETGDTLRSGVEAGIRQANEQIGRAGEQLRDGADSVGREFGRQLGNVTGTSRPSAPPVWAPPPLSTSTENSAPTGGDRSITPFPTSAWTSIRPDRAPPRLPIPALSSSDLRIASTRVGGLSSGPSIPSTYSDRPPVRSVLADRAPSGRETPPADSPAAAPRWADSWVSAPTAPQTAAANASSVAGDDRYSQPPPSSSGPADLWSDWDDRPATASSNPVSESAAPVIGGSPDTPVVRGSPDPAPQMPLGASAPQSPPITAQPVDNRNLPATVGSQDQPTIEIAPAATGPVQPVPATTELPWLPLLGASVGLAGSLAANLFLGWSYADARQKYRALVRKTTHAYQKSAGVAA